MSNTITPPVFYRTLNVEELEIFYREAGPRDAPTVEALRCKVLHFLKEIFPVQSSIFSTRAISRWKRKWIGLGP